MKKRRLSSLQFLTGAQISTPPLSHRFQEVVNEQGVYLEYFAEEGHSSYILEALLLPMAALNLMLHVGFATLDLFSPFCSKSGKSQYQLQFETVSCCFFCVAIWERHVGSDHHCYPTNPSLSPYLLTSGNRGILPDILSNGECRWRMSKIPLDVLMKR